MYCNGFSKAVSGREYERRVMMGVMKYLVFLCCFLATLRVDAQIVQASVTTDKEKILLGEPFWLTLEIRTQDTSLFRFKPDSIPHFEFLKKDSLTRSNEGGLNVTRYYYQLTSFDSGRWVIPPFRLQPRLQTESVLIDVVFTDPFDPSQPYHDIQDVRSVPFTLDSDWEKWWYPVAVLLILLVLIIHWITALRKRRRSAAKPTETPYQHATRLLQELEKENPAPGIYYEEMVNIYRKYLLERTGIDSLQQTSVHLAEQLKFLYKDEPTGTKYAAVRQMLYVSDFVKFARYQPAIHEVRSGNEVVVQSMQHIEDLLRLKPDLIYQAGQTYTEELISNDLRRTET
jgi:hypothetical protein